MPTKMVKDSAVAVIEKIEGHIYVIRGQRVMLDSDLADVYQVETGALNRAVRRNLARFPSDFVFQLSDEEVESLKCQIGISKKGRGGRRYSPFVFTEHGAVRTLRHWKNWLNYCEWLKLGARRTLKRPRVLVTDANHAVNGVGKYRERRKAS